MMETEPDVASTTVAPEPDKQAPKRNHWRSVMGWVITIAAALLISTGTRAYAVQSFFIPTPSMTPTLMPGDRILVDKLSGTIHRGDIVVFKNPPADVGGPPTLVKRVIGLPGETISAHNDDIYIDGKELAQPWLPKHDPNTNTPAFGPISIPANNYFVMGDNRTDSCDSRYWGPINRSLIVGKVELETLWHAVPSYPTVSEVWLRLLESRR